MFDDSYKKRILLKFKKSKQLHGSVVAYVLILFYITRDSINSGLICLTYKFENKHYIEKKEVIFLEPKNQGYGDLLFQTPVFESLMGAGYKVSIVIQEKHLPIIKDNPNISNIYYWRNWSEMIKLSIKSQGYVVFLGRSTLIETLFGLMFFRSQKVLLDKDLNLWRKLFSDNHTRAWQELVKIYISSNLKFQKPKIYLTSRSISSNKNKSIGVIVGVDKDEKRYSKMELLIMELSKQKEITVYLIGACEKRYSYIFHNYMNKPYINLINKQDYNEVIRQIALMDVVIGTEGSLVHVSTTLNVPTIIIEKDRSFWNYSDFDKRKDIVTLKKEVSVVTIIENLKLLTRTN